MLVKGTRTSVNLQNLTCITFEKQQDDSALTNIHLSDPSERQVDGNADEDEKRDEKVWTPAVSRRLWCPVQSP